MRTVNNIISVACTTVRFFIIKLFLGKKFKCGLIGRFSPGVSMDLERGSETIIGKSVRAHSGTKIKARKGAKLTIGDKTSFNYNNIVICRHEIKIGNGVEFGPNVFIYDHDHDFRIPGGIKKKKYKYGNVEIGDNCWIGANTVILRNTKLGANCVVAAGSVIHGAFPENTVIVQKRETTVIPFLEE